MHSAALRAAGVNPVDAYIRTGTYRRKPPLPYTPGSDDRDLVDIHAALVAGLGNGTLNPVIGRELPLAEATRAYEAVMEAGALGKIVLAV